jgi:uncharacterized DUF497 family protein
MNWRNFVPSNFEYDWEEDHLGRHFISFEEAVETFTNEYIVRPNKQFNDRFQLIGKTNGGRKLKIIFQLKSNKIVRIITGWEQR